MFFDQLNSEEIELISQCYSIHGVDIRSFRYSAKSDLPPVEFCYKDDLISYATGYVGDSCFLIDVYAHCRTTGDARAEIQFRLLKNFLAEIKVKAVKTGSDVDWNVELLDTSKGNSVINFHQDYNADENWVVWGNNYNRVPLEMLHTYRLSAVAGGNDYEAAARISIALQRQVEFAEIIFLDNGIVGISGENT